jgi:hypothetical protein
MTNLVRFFAVFIAALFLLPLVACASGLTAAPTAAPTQEVTVTPTPTPVPTPMLNPIEQKEAEINQEIQDFMNALGEYQDYKMDLEAFRFSGAEITEKTDLGVISSRLVIQGCLIDYIEKGDYIFLVIGFQNKDKERFVTTLAIARYFYEGRDSNFGFCQGATTSGDNMVESNYNYEIMLDYLNKLKGKVCGFPLIYNNTSEKRLKEKGLNFDWVSRYVEEANNSTEYAKRLLNTVATNGLENHVNDIVSDRVGIWKGSIGKSEPIIGLDEIDYESLDGLKVPFIMHQLHCKNINSN